VTLIFNTQAVSLLTLALSGKSISTLPPSGIKTHFNFPVFPNRVTAVLSLLNSFEADPKITLLFSGHSRVIAYTTLGLEVYLLKWFYWFAIFIPINEVLTKH